MNNPRYLLLLENYAKYDQMTILLALMALLIVLTGWAFMRSRGSFYQLLQKCYFGFTLAAWVGTLAGTAIVLILGGYS